MIKPKLIIKDFPNVNFASSSMLHGFDKNFIAENPEVLEIRNSSKLPSSNTILMLAENLQDFIAEQLHIEDELDQLFVELNFHQPIVLFKQLYVNKLAKRRLHNTTFSYSWDELESWRQSVVPQIKDQEWATANYACNQTEPEIKEKLVQWCIYVLLKNPDLTKNWVAFNLPEKYEPDNLIPLLTNEQGILHSPSYKFRQGFGHTDRVWPSRNVSLEANYCVVCHPKSGDFCRIGFPLKKGLPELKTNLHDELLVGCPLEQHISEMNLLLQKGKPLAALAVAMINNPMIAATGNRICHDCMSACIYQKQTPVDIPNIESAMLDMVLNLPWGIEIYYLLTLWNPLRNRQFLPKDFNGHKVAVMGLGPAGFTAAYHLLMEGCAVVGFDGQAMTVLPSEYAKPIYSYQDLKSNLPDRKSIGFGGVAEYGITARWDKNLLTVLRIILSRNKCFSSFSSVRFGGNWQLADAWQQGFSHVVLAVGAGLPNVPKIPGSLAPGMRTANDFLMALHLGLAARDNSQSSLEVRLPAIVIGAGLTAIDTATELQAYYLLLIERVLMRYESHFFEKEEELKQIFSESEWSHIQSWLDHGRSLRAAKKAAIESGDKLDVVKLLHEWGGVTVVYRKRIQDSPAYRENYRELAKAMAEGVLFCELREPIAIELNKDGYVAGVRFKDLSQPGIIQIMPASTVWSAIGTKLNVAYSFEHKADIEKSTAFSYKSFAWQESLVPAAITHCKDGELDKLPIFTNVTVQAGVSFIGDTHPAFHGSVVKAMSSAKRAYPVIMRRILSLPTPKLSLEDFQVNINLAFTNTLRDVRHDKYGLWLKVHAPMIAKHWQPGMFCRIWLPGYDAIFLVPISVAENELELYCVEPTKAVLEIPNFPLQILGPTGVRYNLSKPDLHRLWFVDSENLPYVLALLPNINVKKLFLIIHHGPEISPRLIDMLQPGQWVLAGVNADSAWSEMPNSLIYQERLSAFLGDVQIEEIALFTQAGLTKALSALLSMNARWSSDTVKILAQAIGPMQCGLKGVCAQCLQWQLDPVTGERTKAVYGCSWQNQPLKLIDLSHVQERAAISGAWGKFLQY